MKVSIIINNFNYARFVATAVESALAQTHSPCEVIVVDDGSTDESRELLEPFRERVQLVFKPNGGQASAFNAGLRVAAGDLVAFLDSDDALLPEAMQKAVSAWTANASKVQFPLEILDHHNRRTGLLMPRGQLSEGSLVKQFLETGRYVTSPNSGNLFCRPFLEKIFPIPEDQFETGDGYINTCAPFYGTVIALSEPLGFYRIHGPSLSSVAHDGVVHLPQMKRLMRHAMAEKVLLESLARERGLALSTRAVFSHWMHLKLKMSLDRLSHPASVSRFRELMRSACGMAVSVIESQELTVLRKVQHILWAFAVAVLPSGQATKFIEYAFDHAPTSAVSRFLRRM